MDLVDPLTDLNAVAVYLVATDEFRGIQVRCNVSPRRPNQPEVLVHWFQEIESEDPEVTWRFDSGEVLTEPWNLSTSGESTFYAGDAQDFIWSLMVSDRLVVRTTANRIFTATFELEGLAEVLRPYEETCDWVGF